MKTPQSSRMLRRIGWSLSLACLPPAMASAQLHTPAPQPPRQTAPAPASQGVTTLKVSVRRVVVDVTVTDSAGKPVRNLKAQDFKVFEDKAPQVVKSFEVHELTATPAPPMPKLPVNTFANLSSGPSGGPTTVILYDLLNTPQDAQPFAHQQLLSFLRSHKTNSQVAIFVLSDRLHMLQGFTDDDNKLIAALSQPAGKGYRSGLLQGAGEGTQASDQLVQTEGNANGAAAQPDAAFQQISAMLQHMETTETSYLNDRRVDITVEALQDIARFLIGLPGRKNLLWLSGSFPSGILPDADLGGRDSVDVSRNYSQTIVEATDLLTLSHVAVYPIDVRGLQPNAMFSAANHPSFEPGQGKDSKAVRDFSRVNSSEHATMDTIADSTGGHAFYNTNGLAQAEAAAVEEGSYYYTLTYAPTNATYDGKVRKVRIEVTQPGLQLAYRRSYFADDLDNVARRQMDNPDDLLAASLQHGAPSSHELFFEAHVQTEGDPVQATPEQMDQLLRYEAMATRSKRKAIEERGAPVMLQRYVVQFALLPRQLDMRQGEDGLRRDSLEFAVISFNDDGLTLNGVRTDLQDVIHPDRWSLMLQEGYHVPMAAQIPVQARSLRLAVRDVGNNHVGSLEIALPLAKETPAPVAPVPPAQQ
jgi:VWFA-related protein